METNLCKQGYAPVTAGAIDVTVTEITSLGRHVLSNVDSSIAKNVDLKVGFLYEIDRKLLPPESPIQLKSIRVAMVTEKNELNITVRFPSMLALRVYFSGGNSQAELANLPENKNPDLDEQYVMGAKLAKEVLYRLISPAEFQEQGRLQSFWLVPSKIGERSTSIMKDGNAYDETSVQGLNCDGLLNWGVRGKISFMERHYSGSKTPRAASSSSLVKEEEDIQKEVTTVEETKRVLRKRKRKGIVKQNKKSIVARREEKKKPSSKTKRHKLKLFYDRWSRDRYKNAEVKMLEIMKEKGAVVGRPILHPTLRLEARKHIWDTGLLDHLLKHMAGKIAPNGEDRFRRRHNADGAMEYWLESADLVNVRKNAGVNDPFWIPPLGWKPGDSLAQDSNTCVVELKLLKEEMTSNKKNVQEIQLKKDQDNRDKAIVPFTKSSNENSNLESDNKLIASQEGYESLMKRKTELEQDLLQISQSFKGFQGTTCFCVLYNKDTLIMVCDGRLKNHTYIATDNETKFHPITPNVFALVAGNFYITTTVVDNLEARGFRKNTSITIHDMADTMLEELKDVTEEANEKKDGTSEDQYIRTLTGCFLLAGFDRASPVLYELDITSEKPKRRILSCIAGLGNGWQLIKKKLKRHGYLREKDEDRVFESIQKCMIEALLKEKDSGGIISIRKITKLDKKPRLVSCEHVVSLYTEHYTQYEAKDEKQTLFLICPLGTHQYSIEGYFKNEFREELNTSHVICWIEDKIGLKGKHQFRRVEFESEIANEVYTKLSQIPSTLSLEVDSLKLLKILIVVTDEAERQPKGIQKEIFVTRASEEILNYIISGGFETLLPPPEDENGDFIGDEV